jgi:predicted enzyme related to lactoylglutathione lyase
VRHALGTFCFAELVSSDTAAARQFYGDLFGWTTEEIPGPTHPYWLFQIEGCVVAGLRPVPRGRQRWIPYVAVERLDDIAAQAERLGGRPGDPPFEVSGVARMATIVDPHERVVGLWEANGRSGADRQRLPGSMWWVEMLAHDVFGTTHFYSSLFGWKARERGFGHLTHGYTVYSVGDDSVAGAIKIQQNWGRVPERWQVIFAVTDLDRIIDQTHGLGGSDELAPIEIPNVGRSTGLRDDRGGLFFAMQPVRPKPDTTNAISTSASS